MTEPESVVSLAREVINAHASEFPLSAMAFRLARLVLAEAEQVDANLMAALELLERHANAAPEKETPPSLAHEQQMDQALRERDEAYELLDQFAYTIAPQSVIGEHSSLNDPWANALALLPASPYRHKETPDEQ